MTKIVLKVNNSYKLHIHNGEIIRDYVRSELLPALIYQPHREFYETFYGK